MKKILSLVLAMAMCATMFAGCSSKEESVTSTASTATESSTTEAATTETAPAEETEDQLFIAQSMPTLNDPWYVLYAQGTQDLCDAVGAKLTSVTNPDDQMWEPEPQIGKIQNLIAMQPDAINIDPTSTDGINSVIDEAMGMGIPVVMSGTKVSTDVAVSVTSDNYDGGVKCGEYMGEIMGGEGTLIMVLGTPGRDVVQAREDGFREGLSKYPNIEIVAEQVADLQRSKATEVCDTLLQKYPDIDAIWACNDEMALGALESIRGINRVGDIFLGGFTGTPDAMDAVEAGEMHFTADLAPYEIGVRAGALSIMAAKGMDFEEIDIVLPMSLISTENIEDFRANQDQIQKDLVAQVIEEYGIG